MFLAFRTKYWKDEGQEYYLAQYRIRLIESKGTDAVLRIFPRSVETKKGNKKKLKKPQEVWINQTTVAKFGITTIGVIQDMLRKSNAVNPDAPFDVIGKF